MSNEKLELIEIVSSGQIKALEELISLKNSQKLQLDLNEQDGEGNLAAVIAAKRNDLPMLELLVKNGARIDLADGYRRTVEGWAKKYKNEKMLGFIKRFSESPSINRNASSLFLQKENDIGHINHKSIKVGGN